MLLPRCLKMAATVPNIAPITTFRSKKPGEEDMIASLLSRPAPLSERNCFLGRPSLDIYLHVVATISCKKS